MSSYRDWAVHPSTKQIEMAFYLDDYFGRHNYGVKFDDGSVWPIDKVPRMSEADHLAREAIEGREPEAILRGKRVNYERSLAVAELKQAQPDGPMPTRKEVTDYLANKVVRAPESFGYSNPREEHAAQVELPCDVERSE